MATLKLSLTTSTKCVIFNNSAVPQRVPGVSPSTNNISNSTVADRTNFPRGVTSRSTFHAGQQRASRDQHASTYNGPPASPSLSHGNSQVRRTGTGIFSKFTSKFVRRWVQVETVWLCCFSFAGYKRLYGAGPHFLGQNENLDRRKKWDIKTTLKYSRIKLGQNELVGQIWKKEVNAFFNEHVKGDL